MFWTTVLSLHWEVRLRPFAFQLSGGNFVFEFGAVGRSESSKHLLRFKFDRTQTVHFGPSHFSGFMGDVRHVADGVSLPAFRQTKRVLKNVNEVQELRVLNQSWKCVIQSWYILSALIWHMRQLAESFGASRLLHHVFSICSCIEAHLVVYSCQTCMSGAHVYPCMMSFGSWKVIHGECLLQFLRQGHPRCGGQRGPEVEWGVCLFSWQGNKRVLRQFWRLIFNRQSLPLS